MGLGNAHIRKGNGRRNSIVELPSKRLGRFGSEARSILQVMDGQTAGKDQYTFFPKHSTGSVKFLAILLRYCITLKRTGA